jgi:hypothetical protein
LPMVACWLLCMPRTMNFVSLPVKILPQSTDLTKH